MSLSPLHGEACLHMCVPFTPPAPYPLIPAAGEKPTPQLGVSYCLLSASLSPNPGAYLIKSPACFINWLVLKFFSMLNPGQALVKVPKNVEELLRL